MKIIISFPLYTLLVIMDTYESSYSLHMKGKIFGGVKVKATYKNCIASLRHNNNHFCSGFLISQNDMLTAARCLEEFLVHKQIPAFDPYSVVIGDVNTLSIIRSIEQVEVHSDFNFSKSDSPQNIGLVKLKANRLRNFSQEYINISENLLYDSSVNVAGWSINNNELTNKVEFILKEFSVELKRKADCLLHSKSPLICTFLHRRNENLGPEDIGTVLIQNGKAIGVLSISPQKPGDPAIFVNLSKFLIAIRWMKETRRLKKMNTIPRKRARFEWANNIIGKK